MVPGALDNALVIKFVSHAYNIIYNFLSSVVQYIQYISYTVVRMHLIYYIENVALNFVLTLGASYQGVLLDPLPIP